MGSFFNGKNWGFSWEKVHEDAEMLEHATSSAVLEKTISFFRRT